MALMENFWKLWKKDGREENDRKDIKPRVVGPFGRFGASVGKKRRSGQIAAIRIPKRLFYPTFAVEAKLPFPMETGG
jgi:hypothetical protein